MTKTVNTALVTGSTSGLGFEVAAQLAERGIQEVIISGRTKEKAEIARNALVERTGKEVFAPLEIDNDDLANVEAASDSLLKRGGSIDLMILNAGIAAPSKLSMSSDGFERTISSSLLGHHVLTMRLLEHGLISQNATIVIAGSEAAMGSVPLFTPIDLHAMADSHFAGTLQHAIHAQIRMESPASYKPGPVYATAKVFVAQWAAELSQHLPDGIRVMAVSPGSTPSTDVVRNANFVMRYLMVPIIRLLPGMSHTVAAGAKRYIDASERGKEANGRFFASAPKKMTGPLHVVDLPHISDDAAQKAVWAAVTELTSVALPKSA